MGLGLEFGATCSSARRVGAEEEGDGGLADADESADCPPI